MSTPRALSIAAFTCAISGCLAAAPRAAGVVVSPADGSANAAWSEDERQADLVMRNLRQSDEASFHLLRVRTELRPRKHERSDLVMLVVSGQLELTLGSRHVPAAPGDVIEVPRGVPYGIKTQSARAGVVYLIYTPAFEPNDVRNVVERQGEPSWNWNLWTQ